MKMKLSLATLILCLASFVCADAISVIDSKGNTVTLEQPAQRIVSLSPSTTESLFDIGAGHLIVGTSSWSNYPAAAKDIEIVNDYYSVNFERIQELNPDLIVLWRNQVEGAIDKLALMGVPIYFMDPANLSQIAEQQRNLGKLTGHEQQAAEVSAKVSEFVDYYQQQLAAQAAKTTQRFFVHVWSEPLYTVEKDGFIASVFALCGGENVLADVQLNGSQVNLEAVIARNPESIFYFAQDDSGLSIWQDFVSLDAVKNQRLYWLSSDLTNRPTMSLLQGATQICAKLQPNIAPFNALATEAK